MDSNSEELLNYEFFSILSHPIRITILKQLNIGVRSFSDLQSEDERVTSSKLNFHLKKLIQLKIITKSGKNYILTDLGLHVLQFLETFDFQMLKEDVLGNEFTSESNLHQLQDSEKKLYHEPILITRPEGLPVGISTFSVYPPIFEKLFENSCISIPLPKPISVSDPNKWIISFINPLKQLLRKNNNLFYWIEDRYLKLAYGTRGLSDYSLYDASLSVPPLKSFFDPFIDNLTFRGKVGLFASTGMGKSRIILYTANYWIRKFDSPVVYIDSPVDLFDWEWGKLTEILSGKSAISVNGSNPRPLLIIEDTHLLPDKKLEIIRKLAHHASPKTWSIIITYTEFIPSLTAKNKLGIEIKYNSIDGLKKKLIPDENISTFNLDEQWKEWKPYFYVWIKWVAFDILFEKIKWQKSEWKQLRIENYNSPWSFVVALGFLKYSLNGLISEKTRKNNFPLVVYSLLASLYIINNEFQLPLHKLVQILELQYGSELEKMTGSDYKVKIENLIDHWTEPEVRLLPPFTFKSVKNSIEKEKIINWYHLRWANEVCNTLLSDKDSDTYIIISNLYKSSFPFLFVTWENSMKRQVTNKNFVSWLLESIRIKVTKDGYFILIRLQNLNEILYDKNLEIAISQSNVDFFKYHMLNRAFIKSVLDDD